MIRFIYNSEWKETGAPAGRTALEVIRVELKGIGVKEGCREGDCGACAVLLGRLGPDGPRYVSVNSCLLPMADAAGAHLVSIEGLNFDGGLSLIQEAFAEEFAAQCGFCTPGFIVSLTSFLLNAERIDEDEAYRFVAGNICRCTGYSSIRRAVRRMIQGVPAGLADLPLSERIEALAKARVLPPAFLDGYRLLQETPPDAAPAAPAAGLIVGGGTDLLVQRPDEMESEGESARWISGDESFREIAAADGLVRIGGAATFEEMRRSPAVREAVPGIVDWIDLIASLPVRNRATLAGNIANASPIADGTVIMLALGASVGLVRPDGSRRELPLSGLFVGYKSLAKAEDEAIAAVSFRPIGPDERFNFEKVSKRKHLDIASVNSAIRLKVREGRILGASVSAGGVAPVPLLLGKASEFLAGRDISPETVREAAAIAVSEAAPISDARGSAEYKSQLLSRLIVSHFIRLFPDRDWRGAL